MALALWAGISREHGEFWHARRAAIAPGVARLAGDAIRKRRLVDQGDAPPDHEQRGLSAILCSGVSRERRTLHRRRVARSKVSGALTRRRYKRSGQSAPQSLSRSAA